MNQENESERVGSSDKREHRSLFKLGLATSVALVLSAAILAIGATTLTLWLLTGRPQMIQLKTVQVSTIFETLKLAGGLVLGISAAVALVVAYRRQRVGEAEHQRNEGAAERDQTRLYNERFSRASDQLGSDRPAIRIAGIYAMAGLADDWSNGRQTCIDVLCAYLRMPYMPRQKFAKPEPAPRLRTPAWEAHVFPPEGSRPDEEHNSHGEEQVRETVLQVLREHLWVGAATHWRGAHLDFTGAVFENASFDGMNFSECIVTFDDCLFLGDCGFSETVWQGTRTSFLGALLVGRIGFEYSRFSDSDVNMFVDFSSGGYISFQGLDLISGKIDLLGPRGPSGSVSFVDASLAGGQIAFHGPELSGDASIAFSRSIISGAAVTIEGGTYTGGNIWCNGVEISGGSFTIAPSQWPETALDFCGTELAFDDLLISAGTLELRRVRFAGSVVHLDDLEVTGGTLSFLSCESRGEHPSFRNPTFRGGAVRFSQGLPDASMLPLADTLRSAGASIDWISGEESAAPQPGC